MQSNVDLFCVETNELNIQSLVMCISTMPDNNRHTIKLNISHKTIYYAKRGISQIHILSTNNVLCYLRCSTAPKVFPKIPYDLS